MNVIAKPADGTCRKPHATAVSDPGALIDYILERFHMVHRAELPELIGLAEKVEEAEADHPHCPKGLAKFLRETFVELENHMQKEEMVLFPLLRRGGGVMAGMPIMRMRQEHDDHDVRLQELERFILNHIDDETTSESWKLLNQGCHKLSADLREHIRLENEKLFPAFE